MPDIETDPNKAFRVKLGQGGELKINLGKIQVTNKNPQPVVNRAAQGPPPATGRSDYTVLSQSNGVGVRIFDLAYRKIDGVYETQHFDTPFVGTIPGTDQYTDNVITPLLAGLPDSPMRDHFYQIPKSELSMRADDPEWPYYGLFAFDYAGGDGYFSTFPTVADDGTITVKRNTADPDGELEINSAWWTALPGWPFIPEDPPGWTNTLATGYGFLMTLLDGIHLFSGYHATSLPDYDAAPVVIPAVSGTRQLDVFFPPWLHSFVIVHPNYNFGIVSREDWLSGPGSPPSAALLGDVPFSTPLICIVEGWGGQRFYIWDDNGLGA